MLGYNLNDESVCNLVREVFTVFPVGYGKAFAFRKHFDIKMLISIHLELIILN